MAITFKPNSSSAVKHTTDQYRIDLHGVPHFSALSVIKHIKRTLNMFTFTVEQSKSDFNPMEGPNKNPTIITLSGLSAKQIYDLVISSTPLKMKYDILTLSKILLFLKIESFYFRSIEKYITDICLIGTVEEVESMKTQILEYEARFSFKSPSKMTSIILKTMPEITVTTTISCGGTTFVCILDDAEYHKFHTCFMTISNFFKEITYNPDIVDTKQVISICNEINKKDSNVCHSVNKKTGIITLLAIESFDEIFEKIRHAIDLLTTKKSEGDDKEVQDFFFDDEVQSVLPLDFLSDEVQSL